MTSVLEARALSKVHGSGEAEVVALRDVDLALDHGEFLAVTGPSGCGKSTLLNLLGGLDRATAGEIYLHGERVDGAGEARRARLRRSELGFVFQFFNLIENLTVADNVELPGLLAGLTAREAKSRRTELLTTLGIAEHAGQSPTRLSGGQQQRVAIARALINRPRVLLADEPTGNLDSASARHVMALLRETHDERGKEDVLGRGENGIEGAAGSREGDQDGQAAAG